jgi:hypothetical protein
MKVMLSWLLSVFEGPPGKDARPKSNEGGGVHTNGATAQHKERVSGSAGQLTTLFPLLAVLQKFVGWAYENEWRYVQFQEKPTSDRARAMPVASRVLLGAKATASTRNELLAICQEKDVPIWQMRMSNDKYELLADPL